MPSIDLMPPVELERRDKLALIKRWGWIAVFALLLVALASGGAFYLQLTAAQRLAAESAATETLLEELASLSDVSTALAMRTGLQNFRAQAMAADIGWTPLFAGMVELLPDDVAFSGFDLFPGGVPVTDDPTAETGLTGSLTFVSPTPVEIAPVIRAFRDLRGIVDVDGYELAAQEEAGDVREYVYVIETTFDQTLYTNDYAVQGEK